MHGVFLESIKRFFIGHLQFEYLIVRIKLVSNSMDFYLFGVRDGLAILPFQSPIVSLDLQKHLLTYGSDS